MNTSQSDQLFDLSYLNHIFRGNVDMINNILTLFLEQVPQYIQEMEDCVERDDLFALHPVAHKAKSSISMLGLKSVEVNIHQIEEDSKRHRNLENLPLLVDKVKEECAVVYGQLRNVLHRSSAA